MRRTITLWFGTRFSLALFRFECKIMQSTPCWAPVNFLIVTFERLCVSNRIQTASVYLQRPKTQHKITQSPRSTGTLPCTRPDKSISSVNIDDTCSEMCCPIDRSKRAKARNVAAVPTEPFHTHTHTAHIFASSLNGTPPHHRTFPATEFMSCR